MIKQRLQTKLPLFADFTVSLFSCLHLLINYNFLFNIKMLKNVIKMFQKSEFLS